MALPASPVRPEAPEPHIPDRLTWKRTTVAGRPAEYGVAGEGLPVLFLHGWALGQHSYRAALKRLVRLGCKVWAPAMPGFGGTADLPARHFSFTGYAEWVDEFLDTVGVDEPVFVIGHSFGGGVSIKLAHLFPERVRYLVLVNSVGGSTWTAAGTTVRSMAERPLWDWGLHFPRDVLPLPQFTRILPVLLEDAVPNAIRNPLALWRVAQLARKADLTPELEELKARKVPVVVLWGDKDQIIPRASFDALCRAIGTTGEVVPGSHSWLLADPDAFGEVMTNVVEVARMARELEKEPQPARPGIVTRLRRRRPWAEPAREMPSFSKPKVSSKAKALSTAKASRPDDTAG
jgi:pimeloyl-ACP methyl ester carboxylesterase